MTRSGRFPILKNPSPSETWISTGSDTNEENRDPCELHINAESGNESPSENAVQGQSTSEPLLRRGPGRPKIIRIGMRERQTKQCNTRYINRNPLINEEDTAHEEDINEKYINEEDVIHEERNFDEEQVTDELRINRAARTISKEDVMARCSTGITRYRNSICQSHKWL